MNCAGMRVWFEDGTSVVLHEGDTLKCFTATRIVKTQLVYDTAQMFAQQGNMNLTQGQNWQAGK